MLCVTHLPQVASQGHHHLRVTKLTDGRTTRTSLTELSEDDRIEELARMLGGIEVTSKARDHAREMLKAVANATPRTPAGSARKRPASEDLRLQIDAARGGCGALSARFLALVGAVRSAGSARTGSGSDRGWQTPGAGRRRSGAPRCPNP